ncbi:uncharacterized protein F5Z01DRAFT_191106 [Emericellopsis atlantica]|uniref:Protein BIG1 n=1 Tax=Emericellopsis atlantica TaxID=2614577 RepID=A0A9P7ZTX7_9HYPO|nr:uncharacterized protein F5Z01DRAFT_191106 [Emericellopsis atlantica]KAG9258304.1 hypothetical protein F5Z01DRAFT_191106 [Emericellopsis atlantica]
MRCQILSCALALAGLSAAFSDSSSFVLLSSQPIPRSQVSDSIQVNNSVLDNAQQFLGQCPTTSYLLINQPGLTADVTQACGNLDKEATITVVDFATRSDDTWPAIDDRLVRAIEHAATGSDYTIVLLSSPVEPVYEASFDTPAQMELKRGAQLLQRRKDNGTNWDELPLFEKYQFFTPGIFMGAIVAIILLAILGVGLRALSSLEVPYGAFEKDMGPAAQKKQQ